MTTATAMDPTSKDILYKLRDQGIDTDTHPATIKSTFKDVTGKKLDKDGYQALKSAMADLEERIEALAHMQELRAKAESIVKKWAKDPDMEGWDRVVEVVEVSPKGKPVTVVIECQDPQETRQGESVCAETRTIQAQDVFQVVQCKSCQAQSIVKKWAKDPSKEGWDRVVEVVEVSPKGKPVMVVIECQDPQETRQGRSVCVETREILTQDVFQVVRCKPCQARHLQLVRNRLARERRRRRKKEGGEES